MFDKKIIDRLPRETYGHDQIIFDYGDQTADVYFILEGAVKSVNFGPSGQPRTARMISSGKTTLAKMSGPDFMKIITHDPALSDYMLKLIMGILREETRRITGMIVLNATQQVCMELLVKSTDALCYQLENRIEMAAHLGLTRETLSRILHDLERQNCIEIRKNEIMVLNTAKLQAIAEGALLT